MDHFDLPKILEPNPYAFGISPLRPSTPSTIKHPFPTEINVLLPPILTTHTTLPRREIQSSCNTPSSTFCAGPTNFACFPKEVLLSNTFSSTTSFHCNQSSSNFSRAKEDMTTKKTFIQSTYECALDNSRPKAIIPDSQITPDLLRKTERKGRKYNRRMSQEMRKFLENWLWDHLDDPKFSESEKKELFEKGLTQKQLTNWMNYAKKRRVGVMKKAKQHGSGSSSPSSISDDE